MSAPDADAAPDAPDGAGAGGAPAAAPGEAAAVPAAATPLPTDAWPWWAGAAIAGTAAFLAHAGSLTGGFVYDDPMVLAAETTRNLDFGGLVTSRYFNPGCGEASWRPVATLSHMIDIKIWGGLQGPPPYIWGHRLTNVLLHVGAVLLWWRVALLWGWSLLAAGVAGLAFAVHPLTSESIGVISFREEMLVAVLLGGATWLCVTRSAGWVHWIAAGVLALLACGAKELGLVYPAVMAAAAWWLPPADGPAPPVPRWKRVLQWAGPGTVAALCFIPFRFWLLTNQGVLGPEDAGAYVGHPGGGGLTTVLTMSSVVAGYLGLMLWPAKLCVGHNPAAVTGFGGAAVLGLGALLVVAALGVWSWRWSRRAFFGWLWTVLFFLPVMDLVPLANIMAERYCYVPLIGFALWLGMATDAWAGRARRGEAGGGAAVLGTVILLAVAGGLRTAIRTPIFQTDTALWSDTAVHCPNSFRAVYMMGYLLRNEPLTPPAMQAIVNRIDEIERRRGEPLVRGEEYRERRKALREAMARWVPGDADSLFEVARSRRLLSLSLRYRAKELVPPWSPEEATVWLNLGIAHREYGELLFNRVRPLEARIGSLAEQLRIRERQKLETLPLRRAISRLAEQTQNMRPEALRHVAEGERWLHQALKGHRLHKGMQALVYENLSAAAGIRDPEGDDVRRFAELALKKEPNQAWARFNLGVYWRGQIQVHTGDTEYQRHAYLNALAEFERAMEDPRTARFAFMNWVTMKLRKEGERRESPEYLAILDYWAQFCDQHPQEIEVRRELCLRLARSKFHARAEAQLERALSMDPRWAEGWFMFAEVVAETRPDDSPGDPIRAKQILLQGLAYAEQEMRARFNVDGTLQSYDARVRQSQLWARKDAEPENYEVHAAIGRNAVFIPDHSTVVKFLTRAKELDPTRFAAEGHAEVLRASQAALAQGARFEQVNKGGAAALLWEARIAFSRGDLPGAGHWLKSARERFPEEYRADAEAVRLHVWTQAALDLAANAGPGELMTFGTNAVRGARWEQAVFFLRAARQADPRGFAEGNGAELLKRAESELRPIKSD